MPEILLRTAKFNPVSFDPSDDFGPLVLHELAMPVERRLIFFLADSPVAQRPRQYADQLGGLF